MLQGRSHFESSAHFRPASNFLESVSRVSQSALWWVIKLVLFFSFIRFLLFFVFLFVCCFWFVCLIQIKKASPGYSNQLVDESSMMTQWFFYSFVWFSIIKKLPWGPPMSMLMAVEIVYRCFLSKLFSCFLRLSQSGVACMVMTMEIASQS